MTSTGEWVKLGDVCSKGTSSLRLKDIFESGEYPVYGASGIVGYLPNYQNEKPYVAVIKDGAGVGRTFSCQGKSSVLGTLQALLPQDNIDNDYLNLVVASLNLGEGFSGSTIPHIYYKNYKEIKIYLPSIYSQKEIASRYASINKSMETISNLISTLDTLIKARFVEMFICSKWSYKTIGDLAEDIRYGTSKKATDSGEYKYLRMNNMDDNGYLIFDDIKYITLSETELENAKVVKGDLLFNRTNSREKVGKTAVFLEDEPMVIAGYIIRVRLKEEIRSDYLSVFMNLPTTKAMLRGIARGAVHQANINAQELASIGVPVPPLKLQQEFAAFVEKVEEAKSIAKDMVEKLQMLYDSLSQEYFAR